MEKGVQKGGVQVLSTPKDYMHCVLLGIVNISNHIKDVDQRLEQIIPMTFLNAQEH